MRFLLTLLIVGAIVFAVLHFSGFDLKGLLGGGHVHVAARNTAAQGTQSQFFTTNVIAGIVSGLIVAVIQGMFSRR